MTPCFPDRNKMSNSFKLYDILLYFRYIVIENTHIYPRNSSRHFYWQNGKTIPSKVFYGRLENWKQNARVIHVFMFKIKVYKLTLHQHPHCVSLPLPKYNVSMLNSDVNILIRYWIGQHAFQIYTVKFDSLSNLFRWSFHSFI